VSRIRSLVKRTLWDLGGYHIVAPMRRRRGVAVLVYHGIRDAKETDWGTTEELHVRASVLESHLRVIRALGTPISLQQWREARRGGRPLPPRAVLVTFDDGYRSVKNIALPLLEKYEAPAVLFVCTGASTSGELLWYDGLERLGRSREIEPAKSLPYEHWRQLIDGSRVVAGVNDGRAILTPDEIAECARHPLIEVGAHTVDHPILARASVANQRRQIAESIAAVQEWCGVPTRAFAYPNGRPGLDFTAETIAIIRELNVECAFSTEPRLAEVDDSWEAAPRFTMLDGITDSDLAQNLSLSWANRS
jgi:peptidoglycan/xylan/chitin deacetylase (PgdA/CDA1 family)